MILQWELLWRVVVGASLGAIIGYERDVHGRPAGLRTHLIVALAASTFMVVSTHFVYFQGYGQNEMIRVDTSRIAASIVTGIGFLAGGAILRTGVTVQGLTTAAGLWLVTAIGVAAGAGMYVVSVGSTVLGLVALTVLRRFEGKNDQRIHRRISLVLGPDGPAVATLLGRLGDAGVQVAPAEYEKRIDERQVSVSFQASFSRDSGERIVQLLESQPGVLRVRIESPR